MIVLVVALGFHCSVATLFCGTRLTPYARVPSLVFFYFFPSSRSLDFFSHVITLYIFQYACSFKIYEFLLLLDVYIYLKNYMYAVYIFLILVDILGYLSFYFLSFYKKFKIVFTCAITCSCKEISNTLLHFYYKKLLFLL